MRKGHYQDLDARALLAMDSGREPGREVAPQSHMAVVLDSDGKPCRSCTSKAAFSAWASQAKGATASTSTSTPVTKPATTLTTTTECPADVETLGRSTWTLLHTLAASYPDSPTQTQQSDLVGFLRLFSRLYPCWVCATDFQAYMSRTSPRVNSRADFGNWLCEAHNDVNRKLGKPEFDCAKWEERWRTGPKDGSCD